MKASSMATEPVSSGIFAGLVVKLGFMAAIGAVGGLIISLFDKAESRTERALQAGSAGVASAVFGKAATAVAAAHITSVPKEDLLIPVCFLVGALSWGVFGALAKLRQAIRDKGASAVTDRIGLK